MIASVPTIFIASLVCKGAAIVTVVGAVLALSGTATWYTFNVGAIVTVVAFLTAIGALVAMVVAKALID